EGQGLLALMLHCEARRTARRDANGAYVPLNRQDVARWSRAMIDEAEEVLSAAAAAQRPGRFQLEAAIQSGHARRASTNHTDWDAIALLYGGLLRLAPTIGARGGHAATLGEARGPEAGLSALDGMPSEDVASYQPYWALRGHLLKRLGRTAEATGVFRPGMGLSHEP